MFPIDDCGMLAGGYMLKAEVGEDNCLTLRPSGFKEGELSPVGFILQ